VYTRFDAGLLDEAQREVSALSHTRRTELGLAYKYLDSYWAGEISEQELRETTIVEEYRYAKRQKTFFKKMLSRAKAHIYRISQPQDRVGVLQQVADRF